MNNKSKEFYYLIVKIDINKQQVYVCIFETAITFNDVIKTFIKTPLNLFPVSGGICTIDVDSKHVVCYRAKGASLLPTKDDAATVETFLFS